jgi:Activator of Hsp90 ATPase homolog 1-like protein
VVAVSVRLPLEETFALFTQEIDRWWQSGPRFRNAGTQNAIIALEPWREGRVFESWSDGTSERVFEVGRISVWSPPTGLSFTWRNTVFADGEVTHVEIAFVPVGTTSTLVTVIHRNWASLREDHPARHGMKVAAFQRSLGAWWGDQLMSLRITATQIVTN